MDEFKTLVFEKAKSAFIEEEGLTMEEYAEEIEDKSPDEIIYHICGFSFYITERVHKDIEKIGLNLENFYIEPHHVPKRQDDVKAMVGFRLLPNGMPYLGVLAGGDWQSPAFFALYWDGELRAYVPKDGNSWNVKTKEPDGSRPFDAKSMMADIEKRIKLR